MKFHSLSPHVKAATIIAPFLLIGGYIAADFFQTSKEEKQLTSEAQNTAAYELELSSDCKMPDAPCVLRSDGLVITMKADSKNYYLDSSEELDGVTIGLAQIDRVTRGITMQKITDSSHWITPIRQLSNLKTDIPLLMRIALESNKKRYYAEFPISPTGPWGTE